MTEVADYARITGQYIQALREVVERRVTVEEARKNGIRISIKELQKATDSFRMLRDLKKAEETYRWLESIEVSIEAFEKFLEINLVIKKFKDLLSRKVRARKLLSAPEMRESVKEQIYRDWLKEQLG